MNSDKIEITEQAKEIVKKAVTQYQAAETYLMSTIKTISASIGIDAKDYGFDIQTMSFMKKKEEAKQDESL